MTRKPAGVGGTRSPPPPSLGPAPDQSVHCFTPRSFNVNLRAVIQVSQVSCPTRPGQDRGRLLVLLHVPQNFSLWPGA